MKPELEKKRAELLERAVTPWLRNLSTPADAAATVAKLGGLRRVFSFCLGALTLSPDNREKAVLLLDAIPEPEWETPGTFHGFTGILLYLRCRALLPFAIRHRLEDAFHAWLPFYLSPCYDFIGVNDNTPAMITAFLILFGERFHDPSAVSLGRRRLAQLERLLADRGYPSEYNSPTYLAITIHAMAALCNLTEDPEIRARARKCENTLWHGALLFFDREASTVVGPYSRSYANGDFAETTQMRLLFDLVMGDRLRIRPFRNDAYPAESEGSLRAEGAMMAAEDYHCPAASLRHALERTYPFRVTGVTECSPSADRYLLPDCPESEWDKINAPLSPLYESNDLAEYPGGTIRFSSVFTEGYTLGTASRMWHNGAQTRSFFAAIKRPLIRGQQDVTTVTCALFVNGRHENDLDLHDEGRAVALSADHTAMVLYAPKCAEEPLRSVRLDLFFSHTENALRDVRFGIRPLRVGDRFPISRDPVCLSFGNVFVSVLPLMEDGNVSASLRRGCFTLGFEAVPEEDRQTARRAQKLFRMGFVFRVMTREEAGTFEDFCAASRNFTLSDELTANLHTRYAFERRVDFSAGGESLSCAYSPVTDGIRYLRANGKLLL